ncbi:MAG: MotA/TolQ/ExbB proton channel family protein [Candidatus Hydrogenedentales bacterium]
MELYKFAIQHDWAVLLPIAVCSMLALGVTIERTWYYLYNKRVLGDVGEFIYELEQELDKGIESARAFASRKGGVVGQVAEEGARIAAQHPDRFETMFDVASSLATRKLDQNLSILGTIATISPYLGLFGTVVRILYTFGELARTTGNSTPDIMFGIGSALIATAFGLGVAIFAVTVNNYFHTAVDRFVNDFDLIKLVYLGALGVVPKSADRRKGRFATTDEIRI